MKIFIFQGVNIEHLAQFFPLRGQFCFVKPTLGFVAQHFFIDHCGDKFRQDKCVALLVAQAQVIGVFGHMNHSVNANQIRGFEYGGFGTAQGRSKQGIHFGDGHFVLAHELDAGTNALNTDSVAHKVRGILGPDNTLAQVSFAKPGNKIHDVGFGLSAGNEFEQVHVADRVKEMGTHEVCFELLGKALAHIFKGNPGRVAGNNGAFFSDVGNFFEQRSFDVQIFHDHFNNPVAFRQFFNVIIQIPRADARRVFFAVK